MTKDQEVGTNSIENHSSMYEHNNNNDKRIVNTACSSKNGNNRLKKAPGDLKLEVDSASIIDVSGFV